MRSSLTAVAAVESIIGQKHSVPLTSAFSLEMWHVMLGYLWKRLSRLELLAYIVSALLESSVVSGVELLPF